MAPSLLLTAQDCTSHIHLVLGSGPLAASRCSKSLEVGARPILIALPTSEPHYTLSKLLDAGKVEWIQRDFQDDDLKTLGRDEVGNYVDAIFIATGTRGSTNTHISTLCRRLRIPINVTDAPNLCTFTLLSTYSDGPLQIGISTSGHGCKLSSRIRREVASSLPPNFGAAVERLGMMRRRIWEEDHAAQMAADPLPELEEEESLSLNQKHTFNNLVQPESPDPSIARNRRLRWLSQICEYWPLRRLATISDADVEAILSAYTSPTPNTTTFTPPTPSRGTITLAGSGPGHPTLLTLATHTALRSATYILADKLVPSAILDLIPRRTPVHIARKFPGNADAAQDELLRLALEALERGEHVLRLKQGDPYLYGRGAEEVAFFRARGFEPVVLPGLTSALSAPLFAGIPATHRGVSEQVLICTGTGRKGVSPEPPTYTPNGTVVFLMALHRLESLVDSLTTSESEKRIPWPPETPCAVIERASCADQRVIRSTLAHVCAAVEEEGSRPPGLLVVGWSCAVLYKDGGQRWVTEEGFRGLDCIAGGGGEEFEILREMGMEGHQGFVEEQRRRREVDVS